MIEIALALILGSLQVEAPHIYFLGIKHPRFKIRGRTTTVGVGESKTFARSLTVTHTVDGIAIVVKDGQVVASGGKDGTFRLWVDGYRISYTVAVLK